MRIEFKNVAKSFRGVNALDGVSFVIPDGHKVALIGPNGSGKSTLTRVMMGLLACQGEVSLDGRSPLEHRADLARRLAYVPQTAPQLSAPVGEIVNTVAVVRELDPSRIAAVAARLGLDLKEIARRPLRALSGGTRQKLMLALALSAGADLFILDEPTASLDANSCQAFFGLYEELADGATLILCSHRLDEIQHLVDHVIALEAGKITFDGPLPEFLDSRTAAVVEVYSRSAAHSEWFRARGFSPGASGAWAKTVTRAEKMGLLAEISRALNGNLSNIVIRDVEKVDPDS